jgi:DNA recombination protein RmuC
MFEHWGKMGRDLEKATDSYNKAVASFEGRVRPAMRKLEELGAASDKQTLPLATVEARPRVLTPDDDVVATLPVHDG